MKPFVLDVTIRYWEKARKAGIPVPDDFGLSIEAWNSWVSSGISRCLASLRVSTIETESPSTWRIPPRFIKYVRQTAGRYVELSPLRHLIDELDGVRERAGYTSDWAKKCARCFSALVKVDGYGRLLSSIPNRSQPLAACRWLCGRFWRSSVPGLPRSW